MKRNDGTRHLERGWLIPKATDTKPAKGKRKVAPRTKALTVREVKARIAETIISEAI
jgi:hypothetical protein